jgi:starch-binding outer membrane protein, SusD/RagB family
MTRKIINILLLSATISALSCSKELDTTPTQSIDTKDAFKTGKDVEVALVGAYSHLGASNLYGGTMFVAADLLANTTEISWSGTFEELTQMKNKAILIDNSFVAGTWLSGYTAINDVNNVLNHLDVLAEDKKDKVEGESKFIRGSVLFDLVRLFGKAWNDGDPGSNAGVPIILTPTVEINAESQVPRATVAAVYTQAIADLTEAESKLPDENGFFADKSAAAAMLARIYLQKGDYANAAAAATRSIDYASANGKFLMSPYADAFPLTDGNTDEDVFAIQVTSSSGTNDFQTYYSADGRGDIQIEQEHLDLYEAGDARLDLFYNSGGSIYSGKSDYIYGNVHLIRLAELYLIRAEANFRLGTANGAEPLDDINVIRERVNLTPLGSEELSLDAILKERKLELAFEGNALHDAKRQEQNVGLISWNDPKLVFPIPQRELRVNANLTQNPGY